MISAVFLQDTLLSGLFPRGICPFSEAGIIDMGKHVETRNERRRREKDIYTYNLVDILKFKEKWFFFQGEMV
jgi:hypothetical protein